MQKNITETQRETEKGNILSRYFNRLLSVGIRKHKAIKIIKQLNKAVGNLT